MTEIKFKCGSCGQELEAEPAMAGDSMACPSCNAALTVPKPRVVIRRKQNGSGIQAAVNPTSDTAGGDPVDAGVMKVAVVAVQLPFNTVCAITLKVFLSITLIGLALGGAYWIIMGILMLFE